MTDATPATELSPEQLQEAADAEWRACEVEGGGYWSSRPCKDHRPWQYGAGGTAGHARRCRRAGCPHHVHAFARTDAAYCSGGCRMAVLRERRRGAAR